MGNILSFFSKKNSAPAIQKLTKKLDPHQLPPMSAPELIKHLELDNQIRAIKRLSSVNEQYWKTLYQQSIYNAAELIQLIPASGSHHHAGPGGLLSHTIEVCANAMRIAKAYQLHKVLALKNAPDSIRSGALDCFLLRYYMTLEKHWHWCRSP
ncbi:MAG: TraI domain-containing protein [gamma proteobacterium symbiont of Lucinoma myriamae]|nr:TraI domain-containing protein [gamma proteobacterium symbiont of Lucinoma myriamae]MCU7832076.1 TraI domain-containing protein [gamma proteobacterium symbiont of Lucinoma myriamae]